MGIIENQAKRARIIETVLAVLKNGCDEGEAIPALEAANKLMLQYDLTYDDVEREVRSEEYVARDRIYRHSPRSKALHLAVLECDVIVNDFCHCDSFFIIKGGQLTVFGSAEDSQIALALHTLITTVVDAQYKAHLPNKENGIPASAFRRSFVDGFCEDVTRMLDQSKFQRDNSEAAVRGRESLRLAAVKNAVVHEKFAEYCKSNKIEVSVRHRRSSMRMGWDAEEGAHEFGRTAAKKVNMNPERSLQ